MSRYQIFDIYQTPYTISRQINRITLLWLLLCSLFMGLIGGTLFMYGQQCRVLQGHLTEVPALQEQVSELTQEKASTKIRIESIRLSRDAYGYELETIYGHVKKMGSKIYGLWQIVSMHFNDLEPEYAEVMEAVGEMTDNLSNGFIVPSSYLQEVSVNDCLQKIFEEKQEIRECYKIGLNFDTPPEPMMLSCRPAALKQVLHSLVNYALRLTPTDATIKVRFFDNHLEIEHFGFVIKDESTRRHSFLSLDMDSLNYLCQKQGWSFVHKPRGKPDAQGGILLLRFDRQNKPSIKLVHNSSKTEA